MERKLHRVDVLQHERDEASSKIRHARGPRRTFWQDRIARCDQLLALDRMTKVENNPMGGAPVEYEVVIERLPEPSRPPRFKVGDVVQLQSGGHMMCVIGVGPACDGSGETVTVMWSADNEHRAGLAGPLLPSRNIPPDCLKVVDPDIPF